MKQDMAKSGLTKIQNVLSNLVKMYVLLYFAPFFQCMDYFIFMTNHGGKIVWVVLGTCGKVILIIRLSLEWHGITYFSVQNMLKNW